MDENSSPFDFSERIAAWLVTSEIVSGRDLLRARLAAAASGKRLDRALVDLGLVSASRIDSYIEKELGVGEVLAADLQKRPDVDFSLPYAFQVSRRLLPLHRDDRTVTIAMVDPCDDFAAKAIQLKTGLGVSRKRISAELLGNHFQALGLAPPETAPTVSELDSETSGDVETLRDAASDAPVVRFVQDAIHRAVELGASDIHFRPAAGHSEMLFRIAGDLHPQPPPEQHLYANCISRLKILANLDIAERRLPQDGQLRLSVSGEPVDIRVSTMPHVQGEAAVLRLLSRHLVASSLADLGLSESIRTGLEQLFTATDGLILVTGPTGSGKTTTLHAALRRLIRPDRNVVTIEDPVEYRVDGAAQIQVDDKIGLTYPRILRSVLRQDPDIILIGEIRDGETARIAIQAALTGHLVLATLHTNSAPAAIPRLIDMGIEPYLISAVLRGVLAQRLVRRAMRDGQIDRRVAVAELLKADAHIVALLSSGTSEPTEIALALRRTGYRPLTEDAGGRIATGELNRSDLPGPFDAD